MKACHHSIRGHVAYLHLWDPPLLPGRSGYGSIRIGKWPVGIRGTVIAGRLPLVICASTLIAVVVAMSR